MKIRIFTDGACSENPGPGGWGAIIMWDRDNLEELSGGSEYTTNNRMEMTAVIKSLEALGDISYEIDLFSDSTVKGMTISAPGFYGPQGRVVRHGLVMPDMLERLESFRYGDWKITNFEMEGSAIAGLAHHLGHEAITVCCAIAHRYLKDANTDYKALVKELVVLVMNKLSM